MDRATYPEVVAVLLNPKSQIRKSALGGQPYLTPPYLVLHCEEFAWPRVSPRAPVRSYFKPFGRTVSPITPDVRTILNLKFEVYMRKAGSWSILCCTCRRPGIISDLKFQT